MKNANKHVVSIAVVALGVMTAGFVMYKLSDVQVVQDARNGFQGVI